MRHSLIKQYISALLFEMSTRYKRETGESLPRWQERLKKYEDMGDCFIHFSHFNKFGLNPQNRYNTPTGFYAYPLNTLYMQDFGADRPYMIIFKIKDMSSTLVLQDYTNDQLDNDLEKMAQMYPKQAAMILDAKNSEGSPGATLWETISEVITSKQRAFEITKGNVDNPAYLDGNNPKGHSSIAKREAIYGFMSNYGSKDEAISAAKDLNDLKSGFASALAGPKLWDRYLKHIKGKRDETKFVDYLKDRLVKSIIALPWDGGDIGEMKRSSQHVVNELSSEKTKIFRALGYTGVVDGLVGAGEGIIHPNEPTQAVFFDLSSLQHLETIEKTPSMDSTNPEMLTKVPGSGKDFSSSSFSGKHLRLARNISSTFKESDFSNAHIEESVFDRSNAQGSNFSNATFSMNSFKNVNFEGSNFRNATFRPGNILNGSTLSRCNLDGSQFIDSALMSANFQNSSLVDSEHKYSNFKDSNFAGADFNGSHFRDCTFTGSDFNGANFFDATFEFCIFTGVDFEKIQKLDKATFRGCNIPMKYAMNGDKVDLSITPEERKKRLRPSPLTVQDPN